MSRRHYSPRDLGPAGKRLFRETVSRLDDMTPGERVVLIEACRTVDLCERLHADAMRPGSSRRNLVELRGQRRVLAELIARLRI